jgi:uncharacterized protein GlcG (DUF336 family)
VVQALRRVLQTARNTEEAVAQLAAREPMVSHIVVVADARGHALAVERIPGREPFTKPLGPAAAVTNHLAGPGAADPKNQRVRRTTSSLAREARALELVKQAESVDARAAVGMLRDRRGADGSELALGDRDAIDALIATHGVVMETAARRLWVSESPHLLGRFVAFDLRRLLAPDFDALTAGPVVAIDADPLLESAEYRSRARPTHKP